MKQTLFSRDFKTPVGALMAVGDDSFVYFLGVKESKNHLKSLNKIKKALDAQVIAGDSKALLLLEAELKKYFDGDLKKFTVPLHFIGTEFQKKCWKALCSISFGSTLSYGSLSSQLFGSAAHSRAVGSAAGSNLHILLVPCHRLIGSNSQGGFSAGLTVKDKLLKHEAKHSKK